MHVFTRTRSQSLPSHDTPQVDYDKPRGLSLDAGYPLAEAKHRSASPARGILKKSSAQFDASPLRSEGNTAGRPRSSSAHSARKPPTGISARSRDYSRDDAERDYAARACGQLPPFPDTFKQRPRSSTDPSVASRSVHWPDGSNSDGEQARFQRDSITSSSSTSSSMHKRSPSLDEQYNDNDEVLFSNKGVVPRLPFEFAYWKDVLYDLAYLLRHRGDRVGEYIDLPEFWSKKKLDNQNREKYLERKEHQVEKVSNTDADGKLQKIYGMSIIELMELPSTTIVMNGYQHDLPTVIYECVEELYRTGVYKEDLFRAAATKHNTDKMRRIFDKGYKRAPGARIGPLSEYSTADVCGLLESIFENTPEPLLPRDLNYGLWEWCVKPVLRYEWTVLFPPPLKQARRLTMRGKIPKVEHRYIEDPSLTQEERRKVREAYDAPLVKIMRCALRLLSVEHLSLLCYMMDFFKTLIAYPGNNIDAEFISEKFGYNLFGGQSYAAGRSLMVWILSRWERIACGLLDITPRHSHQRKNDTPPPESVTDEEEHSLKYVISPNQPYFEGIEEEDNYDLEHSRIQYPYQPGYQRRRDVDAEVGWKGMQPESRARRYVVGDNETQNQFTSAEYIAQLQGEFSSHYIPQRKDDPNAYGRKLEKMDGQTRDRYLSQTSLSQAASGEFNI